jgi:hypothetical protein
MTTTTTLMKTTMKTTMTLMTTTMTTTTTLMIPVTSILSLRKAIK